MACVSKIHVKTPCIWSQTTDMAYNPTNFAYLKGYFPNFGKRCLNPCPFSATFASGGGGGGRDLARFENKRLERSGKTSGYLWTSPRDWQSGFYSRPIYDPILDVKGHFFTKSGILQVNKSISEKGTCRSESKL